MISGTKISQLPVVTVLQETDFFPIARGAVTSRISGRSLNDAALTTVTNNFPINFSAGTFTLSSNNILSLRSNNINTTTNIFTLSGTQVIQTNSLSAALRITQTGSGNALVVEDSVNPDGTPFIVNSSGNLLVGTSTPVNITTKIGVSGTDTLLSLINSETIGETNHIRFYRGTPQNWNNYVSLGTDSNNLNTPTSFYIRVSGDEKLRITNTGNVGIGTTVPNEKLTVTGNISANTVYAYLSGNSETSKRWETSRYITLSGDVNGSILLDGAQDSTIFTTITTGVISDINISNSANISDTKLAQIVTQSKVSPAAIDFSGTQPNQVLTSTGSATIWQDLSALQITILSSTIITSMLDNGAVTTEKIADNSITTAKLSTDSIITSLIADNAITTTKILDDAVTFAKIESYSQAIPNSVVSRDLSGNLSAVEVTANLKGNASTAATLLTPRVIELTGDVLGSVSFDGSQDVIIPTINNVLTLPPVWAVYSATLFDNLTCTYVQGTDVLPSTDVSITVQNLTSSRIRQNSYNFFQDYSTINIVLSTLLDEQNTFLEYNLLTGTPLTAVFSNEQAVTGTYTSLPSGEYTIQNVVINNPNTATISISSSVFQYASGLANITFNELFFNSNHKINTGHILNVTFLSGVTLSAGGTYTPQPSGLYYVKSVPNNVTTITLSTNTLQSVSGSLILRFCKLHDSFKVAKVTYIDTGNHMLNFETPFTDLHNYGFAGSASLNAVLSGQPYTASFQRDARLDYQDQNNLAFRSILNDGTLKFHDFYKNNIICFGSR